MRMVDIIQRKRDGYELTKAEIEYIIQGYSQNQIPDYQMSAWSMAVFFRGMSERETADLTLAMAESGDRIDLSHIQGVKVDKHSTGGVGDKVTLVVAPLVASCGVPVAKMSGRGLGHTGGTVDKLESLTGYQVERTREQFIEQVNQIGISVISQSGNITPADKKLYALRDVTATVNSIPLIASSIMSKKIASGAGAIVLDVKTGDGAFMKGLEESTQLAQTMVKIGTQLERETIAVISGMNEPLGYAVGNALEVKEAIQVLKGEGPADVTELSLQLGAYMVLLGKRAATYDEARLMLQDAIHSGKALQTFKNLVKAQGGNPDWIDQPEWLPKSGGVIPIVSMQQGYVHKIAAEAIGIAAMKLGAGRSRKEDTIDLGVGIVLKKKIGDTVQAGEVLCELHTKGEDDSTSSASNQIQDLIRQSFVIQSDPIVSPKLVYAIVTSDGVQYL